MVPKFKVWSVEMGSPLFILPGSTRSLDEIFPSEALAIEHYDPQADPLLSEDEKRFQKPVIRVSIVGKNERKDFPFILECDFKPSWDSLSAVAKDMGRTSVVNHPVRDSMQISLGGFHVVGCPYKWHSSPYQEAWRFKLHG